MIKLHGMKNINTAHLNLLDYRKYTELQKGSSTVSQKH
jgi:hypothetical protein